MNAVADSSSCFLGPFASAAPLADCAELSPEDRAKLSELFGLSRLHVVLAPATLEQPTISMQELRRLFGSPE